MQLQKIIGFYCLIVSVQSYNATTFGIKVSVLSRENRLFVNRIIRKYAAVKHGFVIMFINNVHPDYGNYVASAISKLDSSGFIMNFNENKDATLKIGEKHVKIALVDPYEDTTHVHHIFGRIKEARSKIIVICTKKPHPPTLLHSILAVYRKNKYLEAIVMYQKNSKIYVHTVNPFLPNEQSVVNLTAADNFFYNKLKDIQGYTINALFIYQDKTKANFKKTKNGIVYSGKDYDAIHTIFKHINATLNVIYVDDILLENETNPWINSNQHINRLEMKKRIINDYDITVVIHSQPFLIDDSITENTYPHTQDDGCILIPKGGELALHSQLIHILSETAWIFHIFSCFTIMTVVLIIGRLTGEKLYGFAEIMIEAIRFTCLSSFPKYPKPSLHNIILFGWIYYCFYINTFFQTQFTSILAKKSFSKDIDTIQEFYDSGQSAYAFSNQIEEIKKIYRGTIYSDIADRLIPYPEIMILLEINRDIVYNISVEEAVLRPFIANHDRATFLSRSRTYRKNGRALLHLMRESIIPSYQCFQVQHGSPYLPVINKYLRYLQESGILYFWERKTIFLAENEGLLVPHEDIIPCPRSLNLNRTFGAFFMLLIGYVAACIAFVFEIIYKYVDGYRNRNIYNFVN